ncbi:activating transcription factor of chaperone isoform X1 [Halyomorpha halys]|uniref:activating transcription factor of chaperone isoform X1 n=1 Tax=Halyomorpha halys TaxID=286706 RepID=UPI0006D506A1
MSTQIGLWKQEPVSPDWFEIDDWANYGDTTLLEEIDLIIKDEPQFHGWPENNGGGFDNYSTSTNGWIEEAKTSQLLQEFEDVLSRQLTPPDSPQISPPHQPPVYYPPSLHLQPTPLPEHPSPQPSPSHHHAYQPASSNETVGDLDEIVAENFCHGECTSSSDSGYEDPDWAPISTKSRTRPYPSVEERKARKKEQNKNAATRYRQKKKQEIEVILSEERELQEKNESLKAEVEEVQREIKYLKSLMRHMFKAKGIIS